MQRFVCLIIVIQCLGFVTFLLTFTFSCENKTLKLVHILFRHGERSPSQTYTNDPYKDYKWPGGWDQLSTRGKLEEYHLGLSLRKSYDTFLSPTYHQKDIYVESSYADRCIMSAQLLLAGLYPPYKEQAWNKDIPWQPIPVHSIPRYIDNKIAIKKTCPTYLSTFKNLFKTNKRIIAIHEANKDLFEYISKHTGDEIRDIRTLETLYNTLEIEQINNLSLPAWTNTVFPDKMKDLAALSLAVYTETEFMKRMHGGILAHEIATHMNEKRSNTFEPKLFLYSGHDLTVVTLLRVLGFPKLIKPEFGASVIIELHEIDVKWVVIFFYKPNPYADMEELKSDACGYPCELTMFNKYLTNIFPMNWERDCLI